MLATQTIFDRYQEVRIRFPETTALSESQDISSLLDIADDVDAFVFDAFGVLNVGETLITGADVRLDQLRARGCAIRILTNAASYDRSGAIAKFKRLGLTLADEEIITSREATLAHLTKCRWGVITADEDSLTDLPPDAVRLGDNETDYETVDSFLFLSTAAWTPERQKLLVAAMQNRPRDLYIGNADLAAPRDDGFSLEQGLPSQSSRARLEVLEHLFGRFRALLHLPPTQIVLLAEDEVLWLAVLKKLVNCVKNECAIIPSVDKVLVSADFLSKGSDENV